MAGRETVGEATAVSTRRSEIGKGRKHTGRRIFAMVIKILRLNSQDLLAFDYEG